MKKLLSLFALVLLASCVFAQNNPVAMTGTATLTNADTVDLTYTSSGVYKNVSIQVLITKYSGTITGATAILYGSIDGSNYVNVNTDTLTAVSATANTKVWVLENANYKYYKVTVISTTTVSAQAKGFLFGSPQIGRHIVTSMLSDYSVAGDTVTNSGSGYVQLQTKGNYSSVCIQAVATKISGTNGGTITLQGSNDGVNFVTVNTGYLKDVATANPYAVSGGATLTVLNQTNTTKIFTIIGSPYSYYRVSHTGTGTMSSRLRAYLMGN